LLALPIVGRAVLRGVPEKAPLKVDAASASKFDVLSKQLANSSIHKVSPTDVPYHIANQATSLRMKVPHRKNFGHCKKRTSKVSLSSLGVKRTAAVEKLWHLQPEHPGRESFSVPGAGATQTMKDEGLSTHGTVADAEPFVTALKDGFFEVGCYMDSMLVSADKFGNGADQYKSLSDNAIVRYEEIVLKDEQKEMTPTICFEFCRTLPDMVYFGINNGMHCYCTPFYKPMPATEAKCDIGCAGDPSQMCGNKEKSTIFEMHLCDDTRGNLQQAMEDSKIALEFFYETAVIASDLADKMTAAGLALEKAAGDAGAPKAADNGMSAKKASKPLSQGYQAFNDEYETLLTAYKAGDALKTADFTMADKATEAEHATKTMKANSPVVYKAAKAMYASVKLAYPSVASLLGDEPEKGDSIAEALAKPDDGGFDYRLAAYALDTTYPAMLSTCTGPIIGSPIVGFDAVECSKACSATVYPSKCLAFSYYNVDGKSLCFMLSDIKTFTTFDCGDNSCVPPKRGRPTETCAPTSLCYVKMSEVATGYAPKAKWTKAARCFGSPASTSFTAYSAPAFGSSATLLGGKTLEAP